MNIVSIPVSENKAKVVASYTDTTNITYLDLSDIPQPENVPGRTPQLFINPVTNELFYEYVITPEGERDQRIADLEAAMASILGGAV